MINKTVFTSVSIHIIFVGDILEEEAKWAGQIKVTAIRETRTIGIVK